MFEQLYDIYFAGQIIDGKDPEQVRQDVGRIFKANEEQIAQLFSGREVKIKANVDQDIAIKYRVTFRDAGALVEIRTADPLAAPAAGKPPAAEGTTAGTTESPAGPDQSTDESITLLPPNTGSLIDCAPEVEAAPIPDISSIDLSATGSTIDETPPPPPADIPTEGLTLNPANTGSLEDCQVEKEAQEIPDISQMELVDTEKS